MPDLGRVSQIDGSAFAPGTAYMAVKKMLLGDQAPYIFRTRDFGASWTKIVTGLPAADYVHTVREDPARQGLLYAGTQHGAYVSFDDGDRWQKFSNGLPDVPVSDLWVTGTSLAIGHPRPQLLRDGQPGHAAPVCRHARRRGLFAPPATIRGLDRVLIDYYLKAQPKSLTLDILDAQGQLVRTFTGQPPRPAGQDGAADDDGPRGPQTTVPMAAGMNRATWDLSAQPIVSFPGMILWGATQNGPTVLPGSYQVRLTADGVTQTQPIAITKHPRRNVSDADLQFQWDLATRIRDKVNEANLAVVNIRRIKTEAAEKSKGAPKEVVAAADTLAANLSAVEVDIYQVKNQSGQDPLNFPIKTNNRLASLLRVALAGEGRPTSNVEPIFNDLVAELKAEQDRLDKTLATDLVTLNRMLTRIKKDADQRQVRRRGRSGAAAAPRAALRLGYASAAAGPAARRRHAGGAAKLGEGLDQRRQLIVGVEAARVRQHPDARSGEQVGLFARHRARPVEGASIGADAKDRDPPWPVPGHLAL